MINFFITETIKSFDYKKEAHLYKIKQIMKLRSRISASGVIINFNGIMGVNSTVYSSFGQDISGPSGNNFNNQSIDQIEIVQLLKLFSLHNFDMRMITKKVSDDIYPPMQGITNDKAKEFCKVMNYGGNYIAKYWIKVILSNPEYFNIQAIFNNYI